MKRYQTEEEKRKARRKIEQVYRDKAYDRLAIRVKKGRREVYHELAKQRGLSLAGLITSLLDNAAMAAGLMGPEAAADLPGIPDPEAESDEMPE